MSTRVSRSQPIAGSTHRLDAGAGNLVAEECTYTLTMLELGSKS